MEQPLKLPFIIGVIYVLNLTEYELVEEIVLNTATSLQTSLATGSWRSLKLQLRFLGCLQLALEGEGVFPILGQLFEAAVVLQSALEDDVSSDLGPLDCSSY